MFFSIAKIVLYCLVVLIPLFLMYHFNKKSKRRKAQEARDKLEEARDLYRDAKEDISEAEQMIRDQENEAKALRRKAEVTKSIVK